MLVNKQHSQNAFTLLEVILAMSIVAIISSVIFAVTSSSMSLSQSIVESQAEARHQSAFNNYLREVFSNLPPEARITLEENDQQSARITIESPNTQFPAKGRQHIAKELSLDAVRDRDGFLSLRLSMTNQLEDEASPLPPMNFQSELVGPFRSLRWEFFDPSSNEWIPEWSPEMGRPSQIKFFYKYPSYEEEYMRYFWVPIRQIPSGSTR